MPLTARTLLIAVAVVLLAGCGDGHDTETTASASVCCEPEHLDSPCTQPWVDGTPLSVVCTKPATPTPGGTPPIFSDFCICSPLFGLPTPPILCGDINSTRGPYVCPTPTPTPDNSLHVSCPVTPGETVVIDGTPFVVFARACTPTPAN
jgi:hypothetical protein